MLRDHGVLMRACGCVVGISQGCVPLPLALLLDLVINIYMGCTITNASAKWQTLM